MLKKQNFFFVARPVILGRRVLGLAESRLCPKAQNFFFAAGQEFFSWVLPDLEKSGGYPAENMLFRRLQCTFCVFLEGLL